jgi:hypothetical protein
MIVFVDEQNVKMHAFDTSDRLKPS